MIVTVDEVIVPVVSPGVSGGKLPKPTWKSSGNSSVESSIMGTSAHAISSSGLNVTFFVVSMKSLAAE